jgi:hypothetical protein
MANSKKSLRLKLVLPLCQVIIAVVLLISGHKQLEDAKGRRLYGNFGPPATRVCYAINGPAFLGRALVADLWVRLDGPSRIDFMLDSLFLAFVALLWYLVATEIEAGVKHKGISFLPLRWRITVDAVLVLSGIFCGLVSVALWAGRNLQYTHLAQFAVEVMLYMMWAIALMSRYTHDLFRSIVGYHP